MLKSPDAFRTISEVAEDLDLPQHVLRFWETRFPQIRPLKRAGGRRYYRPADVLLLRSIRQLLYDEGYTIKGVQRLLKEQGARSLRVGEPLAMPEMMIAADQDEVVVGDPEGQPLSAHLEADPPDDSRSALAEVQATLPAQIIYDEAFSRRSGTSGVGPRSQPADPVAACPAKDRAALHEALLLVEECTEILKAARQWRA